MTTEILEREQKYEAAHGVSLPSLEDLPRVATISAPDAETLVANYYDTSDLRLLKAGVTLRRREGGSDEGWHLKLPAGDHARRELRLPLDRPGDPVPEDLARLVQVHRRSAALGPVARIETRRHKTTLLDQDGGSLAEVVVDEVAAQTLGTTTTLSRWNEIEVELTGGSPKLLRAADKRLRGGGLRTARYTAKLERALAADLPVARSPSRLSTADDVVLAYLDEHTARLKSLDPAIRRAEPDAVHQMRVTTRRLRSTLQSFPSILPKPSTRHLRDELKWLGTVLGEAREAEVLSEWLRSELARMPTELVMGPAQARIRVHFAPRAAAARTAVLETLDSGRYFALLDELDQVLGEPPVTAEVSRPARDVLTAAVNEEYRRTRRRMRRARRTPVGPDRDAALHETRKAAKRARYAAEAARPVLGTRARRFVKRMKNVQSVLGDHQDAVNARALARDLGVEAHMAGENAFTFGALYSVADHQAHARQHEARRAWKRVSDGKLHKKVNNTRTNHPGNL
jgi:CHAD domain-containing protein